MSRFVYTTINFKVNKFRIDKYLKNTTNVNDDRQYLKKI